MVAAENNDNLQSVLRINAELIDTVEQQQKTIQQLREELNLYRRKLFGRSSERHVEDDSQLHLFDVGDQQADSVIDVEEPKEKPRGRRRKSNRTPVPWVNWPARGHFGG